MAKPKARAAARKPHDMGGDAAGPVDTHEHTPGMAERRIDAMMLLLRNEPRSFWVTDENRRTIESLSPDTYRDAAYYEKWCLAMKSLLIEKGVLTAEEIDTKVAEVKARHGVTTGKARSAAKTSAAGKPVKASSRDPARPTKSAPKKAKAK